MTLAAVAEALGAELRGDGLVDVTGVAGIEHAQPSELTFVSNGKYAKLARTTEAAAVLVEPDFPDIPAATLRVKNPYLAFAHAVALFYRSPVVASGIHPTAVIDITANIAPDASIGPYVVVGEHVTLGRGAVLYPHVVIYPYVVVGEQFTAHAHAVIREHCRIGDRVVVQNGVIVGADGFGFARDGDHWHKIPQSGPTVIEDDVEIQANACIDRASVGETRIGRGAKIDNLVQVGHGSTVGEQTLLCAQVGLAGSSHVGRNVILAGQVGVAGHCTIGDGVIATAQSGIPNDVAAGKMVSGYPAIENRQWLRATAVFHRLPELMRKLRREGPAD